MQFSTDEDFAKQLDAEDPVRGFREKFHLPLGKDSKPLIYFAGNSLGLMPKSAREIVDQELNDWEKLGVDAHLEAKTPWYTYHEPLREPTAQMVGAKPVEVICMNSLTVNLHLMMATFYRPTKSRFKILMEDPAFPSDTYAIKTQIAHHGLDPKDALILARPRQDEFTVRTEDIVCRYGGEEFLIVLPDSSLESVSERAEQLRDSIVKLDLQHAGHALGKITVSLGISFSQDGVLTPEILLRYADEALYESKRRGCNCVSLSDSVNNLLSEQKQSKESTPAPLSFKVAPN